MLSIDMDVPLVNILNNVKPRIRKIGKFSILFFKIVLNTTFRIVSINSGSRKDHPTPSKECLYLNFRSIIAKVVIR
jgi:hypothetical protein